MNKRLTDIIRLGTYQNNVARNVEVFWQGTIPDTGEDVIYFMRGHKRHLVSETSFHQNWTPT